MFVPIFFQDLKFKKNKEGKKHQSLLKQKKISTYPSRKPILSYVDATIYVYIMDITFGIL